MKNAKKAKISYQEECDRLEKEAIIYMINKEREEQEKRDEVERQKRAKKAREKKRIKVMLESAFDNEIDDMEKALKEAVDELDDTSNDALVMKTKRALIECRDANDNSPLGEAAAGGALEVIKFLIANGANPNHKGQFRELKRKLIRKNKFITCQYCLFTGKNTTVPRIFRRPFSCR